MGCALGALGDLPRETVLLLFTMVDCHDADSPWAPLWRSLAPVLTGLTASEADVAMLEGTPAHAQVVAARQHVREQYEGVRPVAEALTAAYPALIPPEHVDLAAYLSAVELHYSHALEVDVPGEGVTPCVVPLATLLNHCATAPHVVRYGTLSPASRQEAASCITRDVLELKALRPCAAGDQVFLSYGPLPNLRALLFYGFALEHNPHDTLALTFEVDRNRSAARSLLQAALDCHGLIVEDCLRSRKRPVDEEGSGAAALRQAALARHGLTLEHCLRVGGLRARPLVATLRVLAADAADLERLCSGDADPLQEPVSAEGERDAVEMLARALRPLESAYSGALDAAAARRADDRSPFARGAVLFMAGQRAILCDALATCDAWAAKAGAQDY
ncbi:hypothetical protein WJX81_003855 [Elliptochloris bilobata]|uniref:Rubisco LSMT substrate-binding domain-containing protein n=1 Tax=Elliptochloris bilobata TaxID=381761 RepID=A0AAW1SIE1_9CHLO